MPGKARLSINGGPAFDFITAKTSGGAIPDIPMPIFEAIGASGIDFARHLLDRKEFPPFEWTTMAEASDYGSAVALRRLYMRSCGYTAVLQTTIRNVAYRFDVWVDTFPEPPVLLTGAPIGADVSSTATAGVLARWRLELTTLPAGL